MGAAAGLQTVSRARTWGSSSPRGCLSSTSQHLRRTASSCLTPSRHCTMILPAPQTTQPRPSYSSAPPISRPRVRSCGRNRSGENPTGSSATGSPPARNRGRDRQAGRTSGTVGSEQDRSRRRRGVRTGGGARARRDRSGRRRGESNAIAALRRTGMCVGLLLFLVRRRGCGKMRCALVPRVLASRLSRAPRFPPFSGSSLGGDASPERWAPRASSRRAAAADREMSEVPVGTPRTTFPPYKCTVPGDWRVIRVFYDLWSIFESNII